MSLSFCDVQLLEPTSDVIEKATRLLDPTWLLEFASKTWPGVPLLNMGFRGSLPTQPIKLNCLYWPAHASRFAVGHFVASESQLAAIRDVGGDGELVMDDGQSAISAPMSMLPARPIDRANGNTPGLYLLTLVDDRFFWWFRTSSITMVPGTTTWAQLFAKLATALDTTISADSVAAAYLNPTGDFTSTNQALPVLLDAAAFSVGQRIVVQVDGTVQSLAPTTARTLFTANIALANRLKGDVFDLAPGTGADLDFPLPASVTVDFPVVIDGTLQTAPYVVNEPIASLGIPELASVSGFAGSKVLHATAYAAGVSGSAPTNQTALKALAFQAATDYYRWQMTGIDARYSGIVPWRMTGLEELVEYSHLAGVLSTRVQRGPWLDHIDQLLIDSGQCPPLTSDTYVVLTEEDIPGQSGNVPGSGLALIMTLVDGALVNVSPCDEMTVYNLGPGIATATYATAEREPNSNTFFVKDCCGGTDIPSCPCPCGRGPIPVMCITIPAFSGSTVSFPGATFALYGISDSGCIAVRGSSAPDANGYYVTVTLIGRKYRITPPFDCFPNFHLYGNFNAPMPGAVGETGWYFDTDENEDGVNCPLTDNTCLPLHLQFPPNVFTNVPIGGGAFSAVDLGCQLMTVTEGTCGSAGSGGSIGSGSTSSIIRTDQGNATGGNTSIGSLTLSNVTMQAGGLLLINVVCVGASVLVATYGGVSMAVANSGGVGSASLTVLSLKVTTTQTANISVTFSGFCQAMFTATEITGLASGLRDRVSSSTSSSGSPDTGTTATTTVASEYLQSTFVLVNPSGTTAYTNSFLDGGQDVSLVAGGLAYTLKDGYRIASATGAYSTQLTGIAALPYAGLLTTYK